MSQFYPWKNQCVTMSDADFLRWLEGRLVNVYGESPSVDFIHRLRQIRRQIEDLSGTKDQS